MKTANPYLNFPGNTEDAFNFYKSVFGGDFLDVVRFRDLGENDMGVSADELDKIAHIALPLGNGSILMGTDATGSMAQSLVAGNNFYIMLDADNIEEARTLFTALSEKGHVEMPLQQTEWAEQYGAFSDRYGIKWMVNYTGAVVPSDGQPSS